MIDKQTNKNVQDMKKGTGGGKEWKKTNGYDNTMLEQECRTKIYHTKLSLRAWEQFETSSKWLGSLPISSSNPKWGTTCAREAFTCSVVGGWAGALFRPLLKNPANRLWCLFSGSCECRRFCCAGGLVGRCLDLGGLAVGWECKKEEGSWVCGGGKEDRGG